MKSKVVHLSVAATAVALLVAACGGGGGGGSSESLTLSGTAATGAALASADVQVKCAAGTGTATTTTVGGYTVSIEGGKLPCIIKVSGTHSSGAAITLHSVADAAAGQDQGNTRAVANVTPVTEMIVAQLTAGMPENAFANFNPQQVTTDALTTATSSIVEALKTAGIDLSAIGDPLKAELVPPEAGTQNAYDILLDKLAETVTPESLPLVVNQIATAAVTNSTEGLTSAITAVAGGTLENCPSVISGKYRMVEYYGRTTVRDIDFKNRKFSASNGTDFFDIAPADPAKPCEFIASGTFSGSTSEIHVAMGPQGVGAFRLRTTAPTPQPGVTGYIFPVQSHDLAAMAGDWTFLESGFDRADGHVHWIGDLSISGNTATSCDYDRSAGWGCNESTRSNVTLAARSDGGAETVSAGEDTAVFYGYRAPNGALTVFGSSNPSGATGDVDQSHFILTKRATLPLREVGSVSKAWDVDLVRRASGRVTFEPTARVVTVTAVDAAAGAVTRKRESDCRVDTMYFNKPIAGIAQRDGGSWVDCNGGTQAFSAVYVVPLKGLGVSVAVSQQDGGFDFTSNHVYGITLERP